MILRISKLLYFLFFALAPVTTFGQTSHGSVSGLVADASGGVLSGAVVVLEPGGASSLLGLLLGVTN